VSANALLGHWHADIIGRSRGMAALPLSSAVPPQIAPVSRDRCRHFPAA
jgi:hypothetical protein